MWGVALAQANEAPDGDPTIGDRGIPKSRESNCARMEFQSNQYR
jgi:hypothetical protein